MRAFTATLFALGIVAPPAAAQAVTLDEGVFQLTVRDQPLGTETFIIQRTGTGQNASILARGRIVREDGSQEVVSSLQLDGSPARPAAYEVRVTGDDAQRVLARAAGRRLSVRTISAEGDRMREFLIPDGVLLLDDGITHHYFFLTRNLDDGPRQVPVIVPRQNRQLNARFEIVGNDTVRIGDRSIDARRVRVHPSDGPDRSLWIDGQGRILRMAIPDRGFVAIRNAPPG